MDRKFTYIGLSLIVLVLVVGLFSMPEQTQDSFEQSPEQPSQFWLLSSSQSSRKSITPSPQE